MPLRRRDGGDARRTFELVESAGFDDDPDLLDAPSRVLLADGPAPVPPLAADDGEAVGGETAADQDDQRRRRMLVVAGAVGGVLVLVAGMLVVDLVTTRDAQHRLDTARGAVRTLDGAPHVTWTAQADAERGVGILPGLLVTVDEGDAVAIDLDTGEEAWRRAVGDHALCGSWSPWDLTTVTSSSVVCVAGVERSSFWFEPGATPPPTEGTAAVTVLDPSGRVVGERTVEIDGAVLAPGPAGGLVRVERVGDPGEPTGAPVAVDPGAGEWIEGVRGRDAVVTLEDAATGVVRWRHDLPFQEVPWSCTTWDEATGGESVDEERLGVLVTERLVDVGGCGISASFAPDGTRLDDPELATDGAVPLAGGRFLLDADRQGSTGLLRADRVLDADGETLFDAPGEVLDPQATDDPAPGVVLVREGMGVRAYDAQGSRLWAYDGPRVPEAVYVLADGTAVVGTGNTITGLDAMTGQQTWSRFVDDLGGDEGRSAMVMQAFTDGRCAILVLIDPTTGSNRRTVAIELSTGSLVWQAKAAGEDRWASWFPIQGRLFSWGDGTVTRLG